MEEQLKIYLETGDIQKAQELLEKNSSFSKRSLDDKISYANAFRRVGNPFKATKILRKEMTAIEELKDFSQHNAIFEYAYCLSAIGCNHEANYWLEQVKDDGHKKCSLLRVFQSMDVWDYEGAREIFEKDRNLINGDMNSYEDLVAHTNYFSCVLNTHGRTPENLRERLYEALDKCKENNWRRLAGNLYEILGQYYLQMEDWNKAEESLLKAQKHIMNKNLTDFSYINKWILYLYLRRGDIKNEAGLKEIATESEAKGHFEVMRSLDYYRAKFFSREDLLEKVFIGTPHKAFKDQLQQEFQIDLNSMSYCLGDRTEAVNLNDLLKLKKIKKYPQQATLLTELSNDLYAPLGSCFLFDSIFDDFFNPSTFTNKVKQVVFHLKDFLAEENIEFEIQNLNKGYQLKWLRGPGIIINGSKQEVIKRNYDDIKKYYNDTYFTSDELAETINQSKRSAVRLLKTWCEEEKSASKKQGRKTYYRML